MRRGYTYSHSPWQFTPDFWSQTWFISASNQPLHCIILILNRTAHNRGDRHCVKGGRGDQKGREPTGTSRRISESVVGVSNSLQLHSKFTFVLINTSPSFNHKFDGTRRPTCVHVLPISIIRYDRYDSTYPISTFCIFIASTYHPFPIGIQRSPNDVTYRS